MKHQWKAILFFAMATIFIACKKTTPDNIAQRDNIFTQTLKDIKLSEPVLLSFDVGNNATVVSWQVLPNSNYTITKAGIYATLVFTAAGNYTAIVSTTDKQATYNITITDSSYTNLSDTSFKLQASKMLDVLPNEVISFTARNTPSNSFVWSASGNVSVANTIGNPAMFSFSNGKTATIKVTSGGANRSRTVWLKDSLANASVVTSPFMFGDKLTITPSVTKDIAGNKRLVLTAKTNFNYQSNNDSILSITNIDSDGYTVSYGGILMASVPTSNVIPASSVNKFDSIAIGTYPFYVNFGNKTFVGTVTLNSAGVYSFDWKNTGDVTIYPLKVQ
jgi:hypothetical protein